MSAFAKTGEHSASVETMRKGQLMKTFCLHDYWHLKDFEDSYFNFNIP